MLKLISSLLLVLFFLPVSAQTFSLTQQKAADDFVLHNGTYTLFFHRKDMLDALDEIEKKITEDYDVLKKTIKDGSLKEAEFTEKVPLYANNVVRVLVSSLGCYLVLQGKVAVYKDDKPLKQLVADEAPPEVDLDNTKRHIFYFNEPGLEVWVFHGSLRGELRGLIKDLPVKDLPGKN